MESPRLPGATHGGNHLSSVAGPAQGPKKGGLSKEGNGVTKRDTHGETLFNENASNTFVASEDVAKGRCSDT